MKYLIKESQIDSIVQKYLDNKNYNLIKQKFVSHPGVKTSRLYFLYGSDEYADIVYNYWSGRLIISGELHEELINFFSIDDIDAEIVISEWVQEKINKEISVLDLSVVYKTSIAGEFLKPDNWE
jgi:hypothetical protein